MTATSANPNSTSPENASLLGEASRRVRPRAPRNRLERTPEPANEPPHSAASWMQRVPEDQIVSGRMERHRYNGARHSSNQCDPALAIVRHEFELKIETQPSIWHLTGNSRLLNKEAVNVRKKAETNQHARKSSASHCKVKGKAKTDSAHAPDERRAWRCAG